MAAAVHRYNALLPAPHSAAGAVEAEGAALLSLVLAEARAAVPAPPSTSIDFALLMRQMKRLVRARAGRGCRSRNVDPFRADVPHAPFAARASPSAPPPPPPSARRASPSLAPPRRR